MFFILRSLGRLLRRIARRFPKAQLTGVDAAEEMVRIAQASVHRGVTVYFLNAFAEHLPFRAAAFDLVVTTLPFHHWADQSQALHEVRRVLSPGGILALADILPPGWLFGAFTDGRTPGMTHPTIDNHSY